MGGQALEAAGEPSPEAARAAVRNRPSPTGAWISVAILMLFSLLSITDRQIIALLVGPIKHDLGMSDSQLGLLQGLAFALLYSVAGLPIGWAVDRWSRRRIIYAGITVWSLGAASCGLARNFWMLFGSRATVGVGEATVAPVAVSLIADMFPPNKVATPLGVYAAGYPIGSGVALLIGGYVVGLFAGRASVPVPLIGSIGPWQAVFLVTGLPGIVIALLAFALREPQRAGPAARATHQPAGPGAVGVRGFLAERGQVVLFSFAGFSLAALVSYAISGWTPAYLARNFGWSAQRIGTSFGLAIGVMGTLGSLLGGALIDRIYKAGVREASLLVPAITTALAAPFLIGTYFVPDPDLGLASLACGMLLFSVSGPGSYTTWQAIAPAHLRGRLTASYVFCASVFGTSVGPFAVGLATDHVFGNEAMVGRSIALVLGITLPLMALLLFAGRTSLRALSEDR